MRLLVWALICALAAVSMAQGAEVKQVHETSDPVGPVGSRPYELDWAHRDSDQRQGQESFQEPLNWTIEETGGAQADFGRTREQQLFGKYVAKLSYQGVGPQSEIVLRRDTPIPLPPDFNSANVWIYGNNWEFAPDPSTPRIDISLLFKDAAGANIEVPLVNVRWMQWWLVHKRIPDDVRSRLQGGEFVGFRIRNVTNTQQRAIYFDNLVFYKEELKPLSFAPRPKRGVDMFEGQSAGLNTGQGRLPFPTREQTILPMSLSGPSTSTVSEAGGRFTFRYSSGNSADVSYFWEPSKGPPDTVSAQISGQTLRPLSGAGVLFEDGRVPAFVSARREGDTVRATYRIQGTSVEWTVRIWQKSLVVDCVCRGGDATGLDFGRFEGVSSPQLIFTPYLTIAPGNPAVLMARSDAGAYFGSVWADWYRSNASALYAQTDIQGSSARVNGGVRYLPRTDGRRNDLYERFFVTLSPTFEEVYPTIDNPPAANVKLAGEYLWQESWGPQNYQQEMDRSDVLASYGIKNLIQCNHEITWRDNGESFTLRTRAAPGRGGDEALENYIAHQKSLGWRAGLYTNYTDFAPVNAFWNEDYVQREPNGDWRPAWPRNYALKPSRAVELDALLAPQIQKKFDTDAAYTDVQTAIAPWVYTDFDARVPGAGTFAQTFYCYGELLLNDQRVYGIVHSEGSYQCYYAGLATGNYGLCYPGVDPAQEPLNVAFDLYQIHPKEADIGVPWTAQFFRNDPGWDQPQRIDASIDHFLAATLAYGHIGWLVEEKYGISRTCRSYYMLRPVTALYAGVTPKKIEYADGDGRFASASEALDKGFFSLSRLRVDYGVLQLFVNGSHDPWEIETPRGQIFLPAWGWAAWSPDSDLFESSALSGGQRTDYCHTPQYEYLDSRGTMQRVGSLACSGAVVLTGDTLMDIGGNSEIGFKSGARGGRVEALDANGRSLGSRSVRRGQAGYLWFDTVPGGRTYRFSPGKDLPEPPALPSLQAAPGQSITSDSGIVFSVPAGAQGHTWLSAAGAAVDVDVKRGLPLVFGSARTLSDGSLQMTVQEDAGGQETDLELQQVAGVSAALSPQADEKKRGQLLLSVRPQSDVTGPASLVVVDRMRPDLTKKINFIVEKGSLINLDLTSPSWTWNWATVDRQNRQTPSDSASGAQWNVEQITSGGVTKRAIFTHPPYIGKVGAVFGDSLPFVVPENAGFYSYVGIKDGGANTDGVVFSVWVLEPSKAPVKVAEETWAQRRWTPLDADLSPWAGKQVSLRLMSDCGPQNNTVADWGAWGEPRISSRIERSIVRLASSP